MTEPALELHHADAPPSLLCRYGCTDPAGCAYPHEGCTHCRRIRARAKVLAVLTEVLDEYEDAVDKHQAMHSPHEGISVIREELDVELWAHVCADTGRSAAGRHEAIQVAAMAVRYVLDLVPECPHEWQIEGQPYGRYPVKCLYCPATDPERPVA